MQNFDRHSQPTPYAQAIQIQADRAVAGGMTSGLALRSGTRRIERRRSGRKRAIEQRR
jgi:hypothetical protein